MREMGLIDGWMNWYKADANKCIGLARTKRLVYKSLTIKDLMGPGLLLIIGFCVSVLEFF